MTTKPLSNTSYLRFTSKSPEVAYKRMEEREIKNEKLLKSPSSEITVQNKLDEQSLIRNICKYFYLCTISASKCIAEAKVERG